MRIYLCDVLTHRYHKTKIKKMKVYVVSYAAR